MPVLTPTLNSVGHDTHALSSDPQNKHYSELYNGNRLPNEQWQHFKDVIKILYPWYANPKLEDHTVYHGNQTCWVFNGNRKGVSPFPLKAPSQLPTLQRKEISAISVSSCKSSPLVLVISLQIYFLTLSTQWHAFTGMAKKTAHKSPRAVSSECVQL